jgi:hypothetical protein
VAACVDRFAFDVYGNNRTANQRRYDVRLCLCVCLCVSSSSHSFMRACVCVCDRVCMHAFICDSVLQAICDLLIEVVYELMIAEGLQEVCLRFALLLLVAH